MLDLDLEICLKETKTLFENIYDKYNFVKGRYYEYITNKFSQNH